MRRRLLLSYLSITIFVLLVLEIPLGIAYARSERDRLSSGLQHDALALSIQAEESIEAGDTQVLHALATRYQDRFGGRVVIVSKNGSLLADSDPTPSGSDAPRNFSSRPEFRDALRGKEVHGTRHSDTLGQTLLYFAVPIVNNQQPLGALRVTLPTSFVDARIRRSWLVLAGVGLVILVLVFLVSLRLARQVTKPVEELANAASQLGHGALDTRAPVPRGPPELQNLAESFNQTAARLEDLVMSQQAFVADASHQLRTPLAALRLRLENLERDLEDQGQANEDVAGSLAEAARLSRLVDGLLELARAERGVTAAEPVELAEVIDGRVDAWSALAGERGVELVTSVDSLWVASGPGRLEQILDNVLANAIEVSPRGSRIQVTAAPNNGAVELRVDDEGPGMSAESRARAFDRFWRPVGAERTGGAGLGLAIVHSLVAADGGEVTLQASESGGLAVVMELRPAGRARR